MSTTTNKVVCVNVGLKVSRTGRFAAVAALVTASLVTPAAHACPVKPTVPGWTEYLPTIANPKNDPVTISYKGQKETLKYSPSTVKSVATIWYYDGNITNQSPTNIMAVTENQFGLGKTALQIAGSCDKNCKDSFFSKDAFNYLAVHFGQGELLFHWVSPINEFSFLNLPCGVGISNYRAYENIAATPLPAGGLLFATGLLGALPLAVRRKRL